MPSIQLPSKTPLLSGKGWTAWLAALIVLCALVPVLNLLIPADSVFHMSDFAVALVAAPVLTAAFGLSGLFALTCLLALAGVASAANQPDIVTLDFDTTTEEYAQFGVVMPKSWNEGTVTFKAHWSHASTTTNFGVAWKLHVSLPEIGRAHV